MAESTIHRKDALFAAAERMFSERGFQATSVRDIAECLDLKAGSLYAHMESKDDLLWEILQAAADRFFAAVEPIIASDLLNSEKLRRIIAAHVRVITDNLAAASVYTTEWRHLSPDRRLLFAARRNAYEAMVRDLVRQCIHEGTFAYIDEKFATLLILSSLNWIYQWYRPDGPMSPDEIARVLTDLLFNGLKRAGT